MTRRLFVTDLDGTLLRNDKRIGKEDLDALEMLGHIGVFRAVATGRSIYSFQKLMEGLASDSTDPLPELPIDCVIFSTGAGIMTWPEGKIIRQTCLEPPDVIAIADYFETRKLDYMIHKPIPDTREFVYRRHGNPNPDFDSRIGMYREFCSPITQNTVKVFGKATEVLSIIPREVFAGVEDDARDVLSRFNVIRATSPLDGESVWLEVFPRSVSKSQAAAWLSDLLGVESDDVVAVGNDYNDKDLLAWAGRGIVVENAPETLKSAFERVPSNEAGGVARAAQLVVNFYKESANGFK